MLRRNKKTDKYQIDRELTWKLAVESNMELQEQLFDLRSKYRKLEKNYKTLQVEHSRVLFDMEAIVKKEVEDRLKKVKKEFRELKKLLDNITIEDDKTIS